jgi:hypothetical protein
MTVHCTGNVSHSPFLFSVKVKLELGVTLWLVTFDLDLATFDVEVGGGFAQGEALGHMPKVKVTHGKDVLEVTGVGGVRLNERSETCHQSYHY